jgi:hypothetical protein
MSCIYNRTTNRFKVEIILKALKHLFTTQVNKRIYFFTSENCHWTLNRIHVREISGDSLDSVRINESLKDFNFYLKL